MTTSLWEKNKGTQRIEPIKTRAWRTVEDQGRSSTRKLVDNDTEHEILESILEYESKPPCIPNSQDLHFLLFTPFRYPPLKYGSRFGNQNERSIFYASLELITSLAEKAFYRIAFIRASHAELGKNNIPMTSFQMNIQTEMGIDLTRLPFIHHRDDISSPISYQVSQKLGAEMRKENIEAFTYFSARSSNDEKNIGVISPPALNNNSTLSINQSSKGWICYPTRDLVEFHQKFSQEKTYIFHAKQFHYNEAFPLEIFK